MKKIAILALCISSMLLCFACGCSHEWQDATCESPRTCILCGATEGTALVHEWQAATCEVPKTCTLCGNIEGEALPHEWIAATCTEPKTCFTCKTIEGEPNGHRWDEATCTIPETCTVCGSQNGSALGHTLTETARTKEPTCAEVGIIEGICTTCNKTLSEEIPKLDHTPGDWAIAEAATYDGPGKRTITCTVCATIIDEEVYELTEEEKEIWYKEACEDIPYKDIARSAENYQGNRIKLKGEISIIMEEAEHENEDSVYFVYTKSSYGFYLDDPFYVFVDSSATRILQGDIVEFYGEVDGLLDVGIGKYPKLNAVFYEIK